jgi:predicted type IV restriction endonuclease
MIKRILILLFAIFLLVNCSSSKNTFYDRKYPTESKKSYHEKRGLMILNNTSMKRNNALYSKHNIGTKKKAYNEYRKNIKYHRFKKYRYGGGPIGGTSY